MDASELVTAIRISGFLPDSDAEFTDARLRQEATDALRSVFSRVVVNSRAGYWRKTYDYTTDGETTHYRIPYRSVVGGVERVEMQPASYDFEGDYVVFDTAPPSGQTLRFFYYLKPSLICQTQTAGRITSVDTDLRQVVVNSLPVNRVTSATIATSDKLDIVKPNGWHEVVVVGATSTISSTTLTFASGTDLAHVEVGDYVRAAEQTDWPCLPEEFHRTLADATAAFVLTSKNRVQKAQAISGKVANDIERFQDLIQPRVKASPPVLINNYGVLRGRRYPNARW